MKLWIGFGIALLLIGGGVWFFFDHQTTDTGLSNAQKEKAMENLLGRAPRDDEKPLAWETHKTHYISIIYPTEANIYSPGKLPALVLDMFSYSIPAEHVLVTAQVKNAANLTTLADDSNVRVRLASSDYTVASSTARPSCKIFTKNADTVEESLFCFGNGRVGSLVVTGTNTINVHKYFSILEESFQW